MENTKYERGKVLVGTRPNKDKQFGEHEFYNIRGRTNSWQECGKLLLKYENMGKVKI